jgi:hypothetical protein
MVVPLTSPQLLGHRTEASAVVMRPPLSRGRGFPKNAAHLGKAHQIPLGTPSAGVNFVTSQAGTERKKRDLWNVLIAR